MFGDLAFQEPQLNDIGRGGGSLRRIVEDHLQGLPNRQIPSSREKELTQGDISPGTSESWIMLMLEMK